ncbi:MAG: hypothetical protein ACLFQK_02140 [Fibrobacterota bacterium]
MKFRTFFRTLLFLMTSILFLFCSEKNAVSESGQSDVTDLQNRTFETEPDSTDPRYVDAQQSKISATAYLPIDTSRYEIHIRDSFHDFIFLNPLEKSLSSNPYFRSYIGYDGFFVTKGQKYDASFIYNVEAKSFSASMHFCKDQTMNYYCKLQSENYYAGVYAWTTLNYATLNKLRLISCIVYKGSFLKSH